MMVLIISSVVMLCLAIVIAAYIYRDKLRFKTSRSDTTESSLQTSSGTTLTPADAPPTVNTLPDGGAAYATPVTPVTAASGVTQATTVEVQPISSSTVTGGSVPAKVFKQTKEAGSTGGPGGAGPHDMVCPDGAFMTEMYGKADKYSVINLGVKCSDGTVFPGKGGSWGTDYSVVSANGFDRIRGRESNSNNRWLGTLDVFKKGELSNYNRIGVYAYGIGPTMLDCGTDTIKGLVLRTGDLVDQVKVVCGNYVDA